MSTPDADTESPNEQLLDQSSANDCNKVHNIEAMEIINCCDNRKYTSFKFSY